VPTSGDPVRHPAIRLGLPAGAPGGRIEPAGGVVCASFGYVLDVPPGKGFARALPRIDGDRVGSARPVRQAHCGGRDATSRPLSAAIAKSSVSRPAPAPRAKPSAVVFVHKRPREIHLVHQLAVGENAGYPITGNAVAMGQVTRAMRSSG